MRPAESRQESFDHLEVAGHLEAEHAAEAAGHLPLGDAVVRVIFQARVEDMLDPRVGAQWRAIVKALLFWRSTGAQGLHAAEEQVGGVGVERGTGDFSAAVDRLDERGVAGDHAPRASACPPRYLVTAVEHQMGAELSGCWLIGVANVLSTTTIAPSGPSAGR